MVVEVINITFSTYTLVVSFTCQIQLHNQEKMQFSSNMNDELFGTILQGLAGSDLTEIRMTYI